MSEKNVGGWLDLEKPGINQVKFEPIKAESLVEEKAIVELRVMVVNKRLIDGLPKVWCGPSNHALITKAELLGYVRIPQFAVVARLDNEVFLVMDAPHKMKAGTLTSVIVFDQVVPALVLS